MLNRLPETPNHLAHPYNLPPEASEHTAEHQMQAQADKFSTHELSVQRLREQLAGLFATQHFLNPPGVIPPSVICPTSSIPDISSTPYGRDTALRSEEHTSELQSLMRISYAVFCLKKKKNNNYRLISHIFQHRLNTSTTTELLTYTQKPHHTI